MKLDEAAVKKELLNAYRSPETQGEDWFDRMAKRIVFVYGASDTEEQKLLRTARNLLDHLIDTNKVSPSMLFQASPRLHPEEKTSVGNFKVELYAYKDKL